MPGKEIELEEEDFLVVADAPGNEPSSFRRVPVPNAFGRSLPAAGGVSFATKVAGDSFNRLEILADGTIKQGSGAAAPYASPLADSVLQPMVRPGSNLYFRVPVAGPVSAALQTTNGTYVPLMVPRACTLTEMGVETTVAGSTGSAMRLGLYADRVATPGIPDGLIADFGQVDTSGAAGNKMVTSLTQPLLPYVLYWLFAGSQLNVTTTIAAGSNGAVLPQATINVASTTGFPASGTIFTSTGAGTPITYTGVTATTFTGCTGGTATLLTGQTVFGVPTTHPTIRINQAHSAFGHVGLITYTGTGPQTESGAVMGALPAAASVGGGPTGAGALFWVRLSA
jgi:hypothetical protein